MASCKMSKNLAKKKRYKMLPNNLSCGQSVKVLLSSFCQAVSCHQVINNAPTSTLATASIGRYPHQPESPQSSVSEKNWQQWSNSGLIKRNLFLRKLHQGMRTTIVWVKMKGFSMLCSVEWPALHKERCAFLVLLYVFVDTKIPRCVFLMYWYR